jgi:hypothetical protein
LHPCESPRVVERSDRELDQAAKKSFFVIKSIFYGGAMWELVNIQFKSFFFINYQYCKLLIFFSFTDIWLWNVNLSSRKLRYL